jgi:hypothetical protein
VQVALDTLEINEEKLENVPHFLYLGQWLDASGDHRLGVERMCAAASEQFWQLTGVWKCKVLGRKQKKTIFWGVVQLLIYGCKCWRLTPPVMRKLER